MNGLCRAISIRFAQLESDLETLAREFRQFFLPRRHEKVASDWVGETRVPSSRSLENILEDGPGRMGGYPLEAPKVQAI